MDVQGWRNTSAALLDLENNFACGLCKQLVQKPCMLGGCEHFFCKACTEDVQGDMCPVCGIPSHVKDIQPDRQLDIATSLCRHIQQLIKADNFCDADDDASAIKPVSIYDDELEADRIVALELQQELSKENTSVAVKSPISRRTRRATKVQKKRELLENTNKTWGIGQLEATKCLSCKKSRRQVIFQDGLSDKFCQSCNQLSECEPEVKDLTPAFLDTMGNSKVSSENCVMEIWDKKDDCEKVKSNIEKSVVAGEDNSLPLSRKQKKNTRVAKSKLVLKTSPMNSVSENLTDETTHETVQSTFKLTTTKSTANIEITDKKQPVCENVKSNIEKGVVAGEANSLPLSRKRKTNQRKKNTRVAKSNVVLETSPMNSVSENFTDETTHETVQSTFKLTTTKNTATKYEPEPSQLPSTPKINARRQSLMCQSALGTSSPSVSGTSSPCVSTPMSRKLSSTISTPASLKKNAKGETPLHIACIKGDQDRVCQLLAEGVLPNIRDHAGWTPLHEACNHGHKDIVSLLLDAGAVINMPGGPDNDTPLHDAVLNQRLDCVHLLVSRNASLSQKNLSGKTVLDLTVNPEMKKALRTPVDKEYICKTQTILPSVLEQQPIVITATGLNREEKSRVQKCAQMLHGKMVSNYANTVTHVVTSVNNKGMCPRTLKYMHAVLAGKWVVNIDWVDTCLEYQEKVSEEPFEVPGASSSPNSMAPYRSRQNNIQQLPGLFTGCSFFFVGEFEYPAPSKAELSGLIKVGNGTILSREPNPEHIDQSDEAIPYHLTSNDQLKGCSHFVIQDKLKCGKLISRNLAKISPTWVLDCIAEFRFVNIVEDS